MKAYLKPVLYYERFELSQHIASCNLKLNHQLGEGCTAQGTLPGVYFPIELGLTKLDCEQPIEDYCYTNSAEIRFTHMS